MSPILAPSTVPPKTTVEGTEGEGGALLSLVCRAAPRTAAEVCYAFVRRSEKGGRHTRQQSSVPYGGTLSGGRLTPSNIDPACPVQAAGRGGGIRVTS